MKITITASTDLDPALTSTRARLASALHQSLRSRWRERGQLVALEQRWEAVLTYTELEQRVALELKSLIACGIAPDTMPTVVGVHCPDSSSNYITSLALLVSGAAQALLPVDGSAVLLKGLLSEYSCDLIVSHDPALGERLGLELIARTAERAYLYRHHIQPESTARATGPLCAILTRSSGTTSGRPTVGEISLVRVLSQLHQHGQPPFGSIERPLTGCDLQHLSPKLFKLGFLIRGQTLCLRRRDEPLLACIERSHATGFSLWPNVARDLLARGQLRSLPRGFLCVLSGDHVAMALRREITALDTVALAVSYATSQSGPLTYLPPAEVLEQEESIGRTLEGVTIEACGEILLQRGQQAFSDVMVNKSFLASLNASTDASSKASSKTSTRASIQPRSTISQSSSSGPCTAAEAPKANGVQSQSWIQEQVEAFCPHDLIAQGHNGHLIFGGRSNDTFLFQSFLLSPLEIESVIAIHPAVADCVAFGAPSAHYGAVPMAYVSLKPDPSTPEDRVREELMDLCRHHLGFRSPKKIVVSSTIPRNEAGKPLRRELARQHALSR